jgi:hypothetical protein
VRWDVRTHARADKIEHRDVLRAAADLDPTLETVST